jgi:hypothetical protein
MLEAIGPQPLAAGVADQPLDPDDEVGIDVLPHQRGRHAGHLGELLHDDLLFFRTAGSLP